MTRFALIAVALLTLQSPAWADDTPKAPSPVGVWVGTITVAGGSLKLVFDVAKDKDDKLTAKFYSVDQSTKALPVKAVTFADSKLNLDIADLGASFEGKLNEKGDALSGEFKQSGQTFKLTLNRTDKVPVLNRPQTPKAPFPYPTENVTFENTAAKDVTVKDNPPNVKLAGTLTLPKGDGPFPAVVLVSGSGPQDRDETLFVHKPFLVLADHFARNGIACLRYDDRGVGKSTGTQENATSADFATDAYAAVQYLKGRKEIDPKRIGICGHSEGGLIAPLVAVAHPKDVAFIVLLAGPGVSGERIMYEQVHDASLLADPKSEEKATKEYIDAVIPIMKSNKPTAEAKKELTAVMEALQEKEKNEVRKRVAKATLSAGVDRLADPWMRWFVAHDPAPVLEKVTCPVLAVNGEKDTQVKAKANLEVIESALKKGGNKQFRCAELKGLNHLFQTCKSGLLSEYVQIEETMSPEVLKLVTEWVAERK
ncbi:MAG: alpha/beta hydrolase family protein [Armatimonadaceae bacterium]